MHNHKTNSVISLISRIHAQANKNITDGLRLHGLDSLAPSHGDILVTLYKNVDGIAMSEITKAIHKDKSTVTTLISKLENLNLIEKFKHQNDSRVTMVKLTKKGLDTKPIVMESISKELLQTVYRGFSQQEKETLFELLEKISSNFEA